MSYKEIQFVIHLVQKERPYIVRPVLQIMSRNDPVIIHCISYHFIFSIYYV